MIGARIIGNGRLEPFRPGGTVAAHPFHTTVLRNDRRGTVERFRLKCLRRNAFQFPSGGTTNPSREAALASLSGRSVPLPFLGGTSGTVGRSPPKFGYPADRHRQRHAVVAGVFTATYVGISRSKFKVKAGVCNGV
jgi:hypothetical protein